MASKWRGSIPRLSSSFTNLTKTKMKKTVKFTGKDNTKFTIEITETGFTLYQHSPVGENYWIVDASEFSNDSKVRIAYEDTRWTKTDELSWATTYILKTK